MVNNRTEPYIMPIISLREITLHNGLVPLFEHASLNIEKGEHVCLIGRNGAGKSTLLKLLHGDIKPDSGIIELASGLRFALLKQDVPDGIVGSVKDVIKQGMAHLQLETWEYQHRVEAIVSKLDLPSSTPFENLSGGYQRRVLLAQALVSDPDILLLDEPTNHLDLSAIIWLETFLSNYQKTFILVTHDRALMQQLATRIVEIDNGQLISWQGSYDKFLQHQSDMQQAQQKQEALFDKRLAEEEKWIRQGIKARRTRNEGRVRALEKMREQRKNRRVRPGQVTLAKQDVNLSGKVVFDISDIAFAYADKQIFSDFSSVILRGDKIGIIGPNGSGKSTLLQLILGEKKPTQGCVSQGTNLSIAYFDQRRQQLDENKTIIDNVSEGKDSVMIGDKSKHIISYLQDFLFSPERARSKVHLLSGGERNRVMLAKLFSKPCNVLVMDEPTNDLDMETMELLEEQLLHFTGTLLLVTHDRAFLDNVVTSIFSIEASKVNEYVGGYQDWLRQRPAIEKIAHKQTSRSKTMTNKTQGLSHEERRELKQLPKQIEKLEAQQAILEAQLADPAIYTDLEKVAILSSDLKQVKHALDSTFERWEVLELKQDS